MVQVLELEALAPIVGRAWTCGDRVALTAAGRLLTDVQSGETVAPQPAAGDVVVAGAEFGAGAMSATALEQFRATGVAAIVARSFAPSCLRAAIDAGLPALVIEETGAIKPGDRLRIDLEQHKIANLSSGDRYIIRNLWDESLDILRAGGRSAYLAFCSRASAARGALARS